MRTGLKDDYQNVLIRIPKSLYIAIGHIAVDWELSRKESIWHLLKMAVDVVNDTKQPPSTSEE